jgi:hypothetical protein
MATTLGTRDLNREEDSDYQAQDYSLAFKNVKNLQSLQNREKSLDYTAETHKYHVSSDGFDKSIVSSKSALNSLEYR